MTRHPSEESRLAVAEGGGGEADRAHVAACPECASQVEAARAGLALARRAEVPEPSPLYWAGDAPRHRAQDRGGPRAGAVVDLARAAARRPPPRSWWWPSPAAARRRPLASPARPLLPAWSALPPVEDDASLEVLEGLAVADAGLEALDEEVGVGSLLADLSDEDSRALADSFRGAGQGGES